MATVVYLVRALPGDAFSRLGDGFEVRGGEVEPPAHERLVAEAAEAEVLVPSFVDRVDADLLAALPRLRHVASYGVGTDHLDLDACRARGLLVTNTPGVLTEATADHAFALLLAVARRVAEGDRLIRAGLWRRSDPGFLLGTQVHGKTLGLVGMGRIGRAMVHRASGFGLAVLYFDPGVQGVDGATAVGLDELLERADFVSLHCPLTPATRSLLDEARLRQMRRGAILVNTARGPIVDEEALVAALADGHLAGAGLDVFSREPEVSPALARLDNVVLTPHLGSASRETRAAMAEMVAQDIRRVARGEPPAHRVA